MMERFPYSPLKKGEIRLVTILPGEFSDPMIIEINHESIERDQELVYEALSYVWGDPNDVQQIQVSLVNDYSQFRATELWVTRNLATGLRYLRSKDVARTIWIDAICINQNDIEERGKEVLRMYAIYSKAERVVVWLGESDDSTQEAFVEIRRIGGIMQMDWNKSLYELPKEFENDVDPEKGCFECSFSKDLKGWIMAMLENSWFTRLWIWQEVCLARQTIMICGREQLDWTDFSNAMVYIDKQIKATATCHPKASFDLLKLSHTSSIVYRLVSRVAKSSRRDIGKLLDDTEHSICTNPRDRIYAQLGMLSSSERGAIKPNYSQTVAETYMDAFINSSEIDGSLYLLEQCGDRSKANRESALPTWVPDWSTPRTSKRLWGLQPNRFDSSTYHQEGSLKLWVKGMDFTSIGNVSNRIPITANFPEIYKIGQQWIKGVAENDSYPGGGTLMDACSATLVAGKLRDRDPGFKGNDITANEASKLSRKLSFGEDKRYSFDRKELRYAREAERQVRGRCFFKTIEGYIGIGPGDLQSGDRICIIPGVPFPMALREVCNSPKTEFEVIGPTYTYGIMDMEPILGPLPEGWHVQWLTSTLVDGSSTELIDFFVNPVSDRITQEDPRMWKLQGDWETFIDSEGGLRFRNSKTGEATWADPRLRPDELKKHGIELQTLVLV